jgi:molybdopterin molybdotransferase
MSTSSSMSPGTSSSAFPTRIAFDEAIAIVRAAAAQRRLPAESLALSRAHGRVLAQDLQAVLDQPGFDNSAMDGFALRHADLAIEGETRLRLIGEQFAGRTLDAEVAPGTCLRITTGAPMPRGADTVVIKENTRIDGDVVILQPAKPGQHLRRAGEDVRIGDALLAAGQALTPSRIALAAGQGMDRLDVVRRPTVAVFTTGDELVEPGLPLQPGQLYNSNRELLMGLLRADGFEPVAWPTLPDDPDAVENALRHAGHAFDVVITCGGVSAGEKDHLPALFQRVGDIHFWKVRMKPGMPVLFAGSRPAQADDDGHGGLGDALFLCLPGNPVSVLATYLTLGRTLLDVLQGRAEARPRLRARLQAPWRKAHERLEFLRGRLFHDEDGQCRVASNPADGSHRMRAAADSDALIVLAEGPLDLQAGDVVDVLPY